MNTKQPPVGYEAVSIASLAIGVRLHGGKDNYIAVRHPTNPEKPLQALSFGPKVRNDVAKALLVEQRGAHAEGFVGNDARLWIPADEVEHFLSLLRVDHHDYLLGNEVEKPCYFDWGSAELIERLSRPYWSGIRPPLSPEEAAGVRIVEQQILKQPALESEAERGGRGAKHRFFRQVILEVESRFVLAALINSPAVFILTVCALKSTRGGRRQGEFDLWQLANNLGVGFK